MKTHFLLPHFFKKYGFILILICTPLLILNQNETFKFSCLKFKSQATNAISSLVENDGDYNLEVILSAMIIGLAILSFSKFKIEDELTNFLRNKSLFYSFTLEIICVIICIWCFHGVNFAMVMCYFTLLPIVLYTLLLHLFYYYYQFKNK